MSMIYVSQLNGQFCCWGLLGAVWGTLDQPIIALPSLLAGISDNGRTEVQ